MSDHINAVLSDIAKTVLLPGDPLRAKFIADTFLEDVICYNTVRNMLGFTGTIKNTNRRVSVQGSGMGMASLSIYVNELLREYDVDRIIRVGSAGALQSEIKCHDIIIAQGACSDSGMSQKRFPGITFAPLADWELLLRAHEVSKELGIKSFVGNVFSTDDYYDAKKTWGPLSDYNVLATEMETAELYTLAAKSRKPKVQALSLLTISNNLITCESLTSEEREKTFSDMMKIALAI